MLLSMIMMGEKMLVKMDFQRKMTIDERLNTVK
jgi:hypothetical protein